MRTIQRREVVLASTLSGIAGFIDAVGYVHLSGYFLSFMSGNTTRMSTGVAHEQWVDAGKAAGLIGMFLTGVVAGAIAARFGNSRMPVLWLVCTVLLAAASLASTGAGTAAMLLMAGGMGVMNSVFQRDGEVSVGLTYMTGTLVKVGHRLVDAVTGGDRTLWLRYLLLWLGLAAGAAAGALAYRELGLSVTWLAFALIIVATATTGIVRREAW